MNKNKLLAILLLCIVGYVALQPGMLQRMTHALASASKASQTLTTNLAPVRSTSTGDYSVVGSPTINVAGIEQVLRLAHSPAVGTGDSLYSFGVQYGIDPIFALAFFKHESSFGLNGWAVVNRSLGNIRCTQGYACAGGYRAYASWQAGYEDWYKLIANLYVKQLHLVTVEQIIPVYAPAQDYNNEDAYIRSVKLSVDTWR